MLSITTCSHRGWVLLKCSAIIICVGFNAVKITCGIAFILDILLMNSYGIEIYLSNYCSLLTLNCVKVLASSQNFRILVLKLTIKYIFRGFKETPSKLQKKAREKLKEKEFPGYFFCSSFHIIIIIF